MLKWKLIGSPDKPTFAFVTCGDWDLKTMVGTQCDLSGIQKPSYFARWINLMSTFKEYTGNKRGIGLARMLSTLGIPLKGHHHSGIDDCRNIASIVL